VFGLDVNVEDLSGGCVVRRLAQDAEHVPSTPLKLHQSLAARTAAHGFEERVANRAPVGRPPALRELQRIRDGSAARYAPVRMSPALPTVGLEGQARIDRVILDEGQIDRDRDANATAPAALRETVGRPRLD